MEAPIQFILNSQRHLQKRLGHNIDNFTEKENSQYILDSVLWATDELHEMIHELPYSKSWSKKYDSWDNDKFDEQYQKTKEEYIDFLHFAFNIGLALGMTQDEILEMYVEKNQINFQRQEEGY